MAQIVGRYTTLTSRRLLESNCYLGDEEPEAMMVIETIIVRFVTPAGEIRDKHVDYIYREREFNGH